MKQTRKLDGMVLPQQKNRADELRRLMTHRKSTIVMSRMRMHATQKKYFLKPTTSAWLVACAQGGRLPGSAHKKNRTTKGQKEGKKFL